MNKIKLFNLCPKASLQSIFYHALYMFQPSQSNNCSLHMFSTFAYSHTWAWLWKYSFKVQPKMYVFHKVFSILLSILWIETCSSLWKHYVPIQQHFPLLLCIRDTPLHVSSMWMLCPVWDSRIQSPSMVIGCTCNLTLKRSFYIFKCNSSRCSTNS